MRHLHEDDVPPSGKIVKCDGCGAPITIMPEPGPQATAGLTDLPAPVRPADLSSMAPVFDTSDASADDGIDLPAPVRPADLSPLAPVFDSGSDDGIDLPAPVRPADLSPLAPVFDNSADDGIDLPAPVRPADLSPLAPVFDNGSDDGIDLPAPVRPADLSPLAPVFDSGSDDGSDLPAPVRPADPLPAATKTPTKARPSDAELLTPRRPADRELPSPARPADHDLLTPRRPADRELPSPARPSDHELLTPRRPADRDLPSPARPADHDLLSPARPADHDLLSPARPADGDLPVASIRTVPAPKGYYDNIPGPKYPTAKKPAPAPPPIPRGARKPAPPAGPPPIAAPEIELAPPGVIDFGEALDFDQPLELDEPLALAEPLGLDIPEAEPLQLDAPEPQPRQPADRSSDIDIELVPSPAPMPATEEPLTLELDGPDPVPDLPATAFAPPKASTAPGLHISAPVPVAVESARSQPTARPASTATATATATSQAPATGRRKLAIIGLIAALVVIAAGAYGFFRWQQSKATAAALDDHRAAAAAALRATGPDHWHRAATEATAALAIDGTDSRALGLAAQANLAAALDEGATGDRVTRGTAFINRIASEGATGPEVEKARALHDILNRRGDGAAVRLRGLRGAPGPLTSLYLGWALASSHHDAEARGAFAAAAAGMPGSVPATYGLGLAELALGHRAAASHAFAGVLKHQKNHIGAQIGAIQLRAGASFADREAAYLALLHRPDIATADPRAVSRAWALAGDAALVGGRPAEATARYQKALALDPQNLDAIVGKAKAERSQGRPKLATDALARVLRVAPNHIDATLTSAELALDAGDTDTARTLVAAVLDRKPPIDDSRALTRAHLAEGQIHQAAGELAEAETAFRAAVKLADPTNITPTVRLSELLIAMHKRDEAEKVLAPIRAIAEEDPSVAVTLGAAYLAGGDPDGASRWFRAALEKDPESAEARFQLGRALLAGGDVAAGLGALASAYSHAPTRNDIGLTLAQAYERADRLPAASRLFHELADRSPELPVLVHAGRFFARHGDLAAAGALSKKILAIDPNDPTGIYLRGEQAFAAGDVLAAFTDFKQAATADPRPQFFTSLGLAAEKLGKLPDAMAAFDSAMAADPQHMPARLGRVRIYLARRQFDLARDALDKILTDHPDSAEALAGLGECLLVEAKPEEAIRALTRAARRDPEAARIHYLLGRAHYDLGRAAPAAAALARAIAHAPTDAPWLAEALRLRGYAERARGNPQAAIAAWKKYLTHARPGSAEARDVRRLLLSLGEGTP